MLVDLHECAGPISLEVLVVDVGGYGVAEYLEERFPGVNSVSIPQDNAGEIGNRVLEETDARYVLFLDPETEITQGKISQLASALDTFQQIAVAGVQQFGPDGSLVRTIGRFPALQHMLAEVLGLQRLPGARRFLGELDLAPRDYELPRTCDWISQSFMFARREALESVGGFDHRFGRFGEADLCRRLSRAGWETVHLPSITVRHRRAGQGSPELEPHAAFARMQFARKHFPSVAADYRLALALRYAIRVCAYSVSPRHRDGRRHAAREALTTVLAGEASFEERTAF
jgi:N-acetylglucosaminyl-diphospho-decaprenol L-rhamnosyltransferase